MHIFAVAITIQIISACGGGSDSSENNSTPSVVTTTPPTQELEILISPTSLDDLVVNSDNKMQAAFELMVALDIHSQKRGYFSLCDDYSNDNNSYAVNFESCLYRGPLVNGKLDTNLKVANHNGELLAVIWFYDDTSPQFQLWQYDTDLEQQLLVVN